MTQISKLPHANEISYIYFPFDTHNIIYYLRQQNQEAHYRPSVVWGLFMP